MCWMTKTKPTTSCSLRFSLGRNPDRRAAINAATGSHWIKIKSPGSPQRMCDAPFKQPHRGQSCSRVKMRRARNHDPPVLGRLQGVKQVALITDSPPLLPSRRIAAMVAGTLRAPVGVGFSGLAAGSLSMKSTLVMAVSCSLPAARIVVTGAWFVLRLRT
jgi:hypothetical protein